MIPSPLIADIKEAVCRAYGLAADDMRSPARHRNVAHPRQVAMFLCRALTGRSLGQIGTYFGRDHTTVMHAVRAVQVRLSRDPDDAAMARMICADLGQRVADRCRPLYTACDPHDCDPCNGGAA